MENTTNKIDQEHRYQLLKDTLCAGKCIKFFPEEWADWNKIILRLYYDGIKVSVTPIYPSNIEKTFSIDPTVTMHYKVQMTNAFVEKTLQDHIYELLDRQLKGCQIFAPKENTYEGVYFVKNERLYFEYKKVEIYNHMESKWVVAPIFSPVNEIWNDLFTVFQNADFSLAFQYLNNWMKSWVDGGDTYPKVGSTDSHNYNHEKHVLVTEKPEWISDAMWNAIQGKIKI